MNSYCKQLLVAGILAGSLLIASSAGAIQIAGVYYSACQRDLGVLLHVDKDKVSLLKLNGEIRILQRYEIIYLAFYVPGQVAIPNVINPQQVEMVTVKTLHQGQIVELTRGWMIDHSDDAFSLLGMNGSEVVVRKNDIWDLELSPAIGPVHFKNGDKTYHYAHPYPFRHCEKDAESKAAAEGNILYPQSLVADPVWIKKELDHLREGHEKLKAYIQSKRFYPVPQLFSNDTLLGLWLNVGSRHGASRNRNNNLIPVLIRGYSEGPFGFQRVWVIGASDMPYSVHEEVQTQLYYQLKADHIHFSVMYDISAPLVGEGKYNWSPGELGARDDRWNELFHVAGGLDISRIAGDVSVTTVQYALRHRDLFFTNRVQMLKAGLVYRDKDINLGVSHGRAYDEKPAFEMPRDGSTEEIISTAHIPEFHTWLGVTRLNLDYLSRKDTVLRYSLIYRSLDFQRLQDMEGLGAVVYASRSLSQALYLDQVLQQDLSITGYVALEVLVNRTGISRLGKEKRGLYPKAGISLMLKL
ncbi:MAG: hypothetical protein OEW39_14780 [Deltaproteobacteria bacterium]|nr:hypothetical protein [Deltaproteobacteria bacterium]